MSFQSSYAFGTRSIHEMTTPIRVGTFVEHDIVEWNESQMQRDILQKAETANHSQQSLVATSLPIDFSLSMRIASFSKKKPKMFHSVHHSE